MKKESLLGKTNEKVYEEVTGKIITAIEAGNLGEWIKPWHSVGFPANIVTKKPYRGVNVLLTWFAGMENGFTSNLWATYKQVQDLGGSVIKGSKGTPIVFFKPLDKDEDSNEADNDSWSEKESNDKKSKFLVSRMYTVFNLDQTTLDKDKYSLDKKPLLENQTVEEFLESIPAVTKHGGSRAFYTPIGDYINLPPKETFRSMEDYYSTRLHETTHWTGHESRLKRDLANKFGTENYAFEELVAELGSAFLCSMLGVEGNLQHTEYIANWSQILKEDNRAIFKASSLAQKAADYILSFNTNTINS